MRNLLSFEKEYRVYMDAMAAAIREFRPEVEVALLVDAEDLESEVDRLDPQLVITSPPTLENMVDERLARIELSPEPDRPSRFRVGDRHWESTNPTLGEILPIVEETKRLLRVTREQEDPTAA